MNLEERILNIAEAPAWFDSRELRAIALDVRKMEERIKRLEEAAMMALHGCYNGPMPDHVRDALADAMEDKP